MSDNIRDEYRAFLQQQSPPPVRAKEPNLLRRAASGLANAWTGADRREFDIPELGTVGPNVPFLSDESQKMAMAYALSNDPAQIADIAVNTLEGATQRKDKFGNPVVDWRGKSYYANRPGASEADFFKLAADAAVYTGAAKLFPGLASKGIATRMAGGAGIGAGVSIAQDAATMLLGSDQGISPTRALVTGATMGTVEGLAPLAGWVKSKLSPGASLIDEAGKVTDAARALLRNAGFADDMITPEFAARMQAALRTDPQALKLAGQFTVNGMEDAAAVASKGATQATAAGAASRANEFSIRKTLGQATRDPIQLGREEAMRHGAFTDKATQIIGDFDAKQADDIARAARGEIDRVGQLPGGKAASATDAYDAGGRIIGAVKSAEMRSAQAVDDAYTALRQADDAFINGDAIRSFTGGLREVLKNDGRVIDKTLTPATVRAVTELERVTKVPGATVTSASLRRLEVTRRTLRQLEKTAANGSDADNVRTIIRQFDDFLDNAADGALYSGNPDALKLLKDARAARRAYGAAFEASGPQDDAGRVIERMVQRDTTNAEAANWLYGSADLGSSPTAVRVVKRLESLFGRDSAEFATLRQGAIDRVMFGPSAGSKNAATPAAISKRIKEAVDGRGRDISRRLFAEDEVARLRRFAKELDDLSIPATMQNPSRTSYAVWRLARQTLGGLTTGLNLSGNIGPGAVTGAADLAVQAASPGARAARKAVQGYIPRRDAVPLFRGAATAAGVAVGADRQSIAPAEADTRRERAATR